MSTFYAGLVVLLGRQITAFGFDCFRFIPDMSSFVYGDLFAATLPRLLVRAARSAVSSTLASTGSSTSSAASLMSASLPLALSGPSLASSKIEESN